MTSTDRNRNRAHRLQLHRLKEHRPAACEHSGFEARGDRKSRHNSADRISGVRQIRTTTNLCSGENPRWAHRQTCLCSVKCHWRFTKTPYNSREPTLQPFNALTFQRSDASRFTLQRFTNLMELNHILLFTAIATSALVVLKA